MAEYTVMSSLQGTYGQMQQSSEAVREMYKICIVGGQEDQYCEPLQYFIVVHMQREGRDYIGAVTQMIVRFKANLANHIHFAMP